jgi:hypothetical protein
MNDQSLRDDLLDRIGRDEPPMTWSAAEVRTRVRRRRRLGATLAGMVAIGAVAAGGAAVNTLVPDDRGDQASAAGAGFDPDRLESSLTSTATSASATGFVSIDIEALDDQDNVIKGPDRDKASRWTARYVRPDGGILQIDLLKGGVTDQALAEQTCQGDLSVSFVNSCVVSKEDGVLTVSTVRPAREMGRAWVVVKPAELERMAGSQQLWFLHSLQATHPDGASVTATELVRASSLDEAEAAFEMTDAALTEVATTPSLTFPGGPRDSKGCGWVVPSMADQVECG